MKKEYVVDLRTSFVQFSKKNENKLVTSEDLFELARKVAKEFISEESKFDEMCKFFEIHELESVRLVVNELEDVDCIEAYDFVEKARDGFLLRISIDVNMISRKDSTAIIQYKLTVSTDEKKD